MSLLSRFSKGRTAASSEPGSGPAQTQWHSVLVPAVDQPFSTRCLEVAFRLAQRSNARVQLAYFIEVPRTLSLNADMPDAEEVAASSLNVAERTAIPYKIQVQSVIHRTRSAQDRILSLIPEENIDLLVLGARPDRQRGLPREMARELFLAAPCEVIVDYIANER